MMLRIAEGDRQPLLVTKIPPTTCHEAALHTMPLTPPTRQPSAHQEIVVPAFEDCLPQLEAVLDCSPALLACHAAPRPIALPSL